VRNTVGSGCRVAAEMYEAIVWGTLTIVGLVAQFLIWVAYIIQQFFVGLSYAFAPLFLGNAGAAFYKPYRSALHSRDGWDSGVATWLGRRLDCDK